MTNFTRAFSAIALSLTLGAAGVSSASAATWAQKHPRRAEVNGRLANQNARIDRDLASGKITAAQAAQLHSEDHSVRSEERFDASLDNSHITKADQRSLNQNENSVSKQIYQDAH
jgi:hypothetical protein